jgi:hypothetical protein
MQVATIIADATTDATDVTSSSRKAPCRRRRTGRKLAAGRPPAPAPAPEPSRFLEHGTSSRARVLQAIALLNEVLNDPRRGPATDVDPDGLRQLQRARGALVRSLMEPTRRRNEIRYAHAAVMELADDGSIVRDLARALGQNALELFWCAYQDSMGATPGAFFMPNQSEDELNRIGTDPEVLR